MGHEPRNRAERRAAMRKARRVAGAALTAGSAAMGMTAAIVATATPAGAIGYLVNDAGDSGDGTCDGTCTLRDAIENANTSVGVPDVITFDTAGTFSTPQIITLGVSNTQEITDDLTITGPGAANLTVDGNNSYRVFYIYSGTDNIDVTIAGLTIANGDAGSGDGGGIQVRGENLTLTNTVVTGNDAANGGGIAAEDADGTDPTVTINGTTTISENNAFDVPYYGGGDGGGLYIENGALTISGNTTISGNYAADDGGGIFKYDGTINVSGTTLIDANDADSEGGGIYIDEALVTISGNTTISNNDANNDGGGAVFDDTSDGSSITGATITGNDGGDGGGVYFEDHNGVFTIANTTISDNYSDGDGGGIYLYQTDDTGKLVITGSTISGNESYDDGGGVFLYGYTQGGAYYSGFGDANVDIINTTISGNTANDDGGGLFFYHQADDNLLLIQGSRFTGNAADEDGGGIYLYEMAGEIQISDTTISGNTAVENGGGIYLYDTDNDYERTIRNTTISGNTAGGTGGGVHFEAIDDLVSFFNSTISGNTASDGGAFSMEGSSDGVDFVQTTITDNHVSGGGTVGGLLLDELGPLSIAGEPDAEKAAERAAHANEKDAEHADDKDARVASPKTGASVDEELQASLAVDDEIALVGTIVSGNDGLDIGGGSATDDDAILSDHSLIGTIAQEGALTDLGGTIRTTNPGLAALADNGGPTLTHKVLGASAALDAGPVTVPVFTANGFDQRGFGFLRVINGRVDIGAFEAPLEFTDFTG